MFNLTIEGASILVVAILAVLILYLIWRFSQNLNQGAINIGGEFKLIDFWNSYSQLIISIFLACIIAILLLARVISAEAGLPILSAISGFAIAKSPNSRNNSDPTHENPIKPNNLSDSLKSFPSSEVNMSENDEKDPPSKPI